MPGRAEQFSAMRTKRRRGWKPQASSAGSSTSPACSLARPRPLTQQRQAGRRHDGPRARTGHEGAQQKAAVGAERLAVKRQRGRQVRDRAGRRAVRLGRTTRAGQALHRAQRQVAQPGINGRPRLGRVQERRPPGCLQQRRAARGQPGGDASSAPVRRHQHHGHPAQGRAVRQRRRRPDQPPPGHGAEHRTMSQEQAPVRRRLVPAGFLRQQQRLAGPAGVQPDGRARAGADRACERLVSRQRCGPRTSSACRGWAARRPPSPQPSPACGSGARRGSRTGPRLATHRSARPFPPPARR